MQFFSLGHNHVPGSRDRLFFDPRSFAIAGQEIGDGLDVVAAINRPIQRIEPIFMKRLAILVRCFHSHKGVPAAVAETKRGVTTHAPSQARECPQRNAFGTPDFGRPPSAPSSVEISRFVMDSG